MDWLYPLSGFVVGAIVGLTGMGGGSLIPVIINHASEDQEPELSRQIARPPSHEIAKSSSLLR